MHLFCPSCFAPASSVCTVLSAKRLEFLANGKVITTHNDGQTSTENYFFLANKLGQTVNNGNDTVYSQILTCTAGSFSIYDKTTYIYINPPAVLEYWHYFVKQLNKILIV